MRAWYLFTVVLVFSLGDDVSGFKFGPKAAQKNSEMLAEIRKALSETKLKVPAISDMFHYYNGDFPVIATSGRDFRSSWSDFSLEDVKCIRDLGDILNGTKHFQTWALRMIDSGTKLPSGILEGNIVDLGQFDECVAVKRPNYSGQHCLIGLQVSQKKDGNFSSLLTLTVSQCWPSTCRPEVIGKFASMVLSPLNDALEGMGVRLDASVADTDCNVDAPAYFDTEDWVVVSVCAFIVLLAAICTTIDMTLIKNKKNISKAETLVKAFSVHANGKKLFSLETKSGTMTALNGIKFFSMAWVVLGHKYIYTFSQPHVNLLIVYNWLQEWTKMLLVNATLSVDTFYMLSAFLNAYGFFTILDKKRRYNIFDVIMSYVHRYIRLTPPYMIVLAMTASFLYRVGDGPTWNRVMKPNRDHCQQYWWSNLLYINNYYEPNMCMGQAWYLGGDMQMFWLSPLVLYPMWRWPIFGMIELFVVTVASIATPFAVSYVYKITSPIPETIDNDEQRKEMIYLYYPTHVRFQSYVVGLFAGWLVQRVKTGKINLRIPPIGWFLGWICAGILMLYAIFGGYWFMQLDNPYSQVSDSLYIAFFRFIWVVGIAWIILACVTGHGGVVNSILSVNIFGPLGRLTYCTYLTHLAIINIKNGLMRTATSFNDFDLVEEWAGDLMFAMAAATVLSLLLEAPTMILEKLIFSSPREARKKPRTEEDPPPNPVENGGGQRLNY